MPAEAVYDRDGQIQGGRMERYDVIVIGGGLVGSAIAYGLVRARLRVALLDEGDGRAACISAWARPRSRRATR